MKDKKQQPAVSEERIKAIVKEVTGMENENKYPFKLFQTVGSNSNCRVIYRKCYRAVELAFNMQGEEWISEENIIQIINLYEDFKAKEKGYDGVEITEGNKVFIQLKAKKIKAVLLPPIPEEKGGEG